MTGWRRRFSSRMNARPGWAGTRAPRKATERAATLNADELIRHAESYLLSRETTTVYARQIRNRNAEFADFVGAEEITSDLLNKFIIELGEARQPVTVRGYRTSILSVLKFAGWKPETQIRSVRVGHPLVECFTTEEIAAQINTASRMQGTLPNGVTNAAFWMLAIHAGYGIGVRQADLLSVLAVDVANDGTYIFQPSKTQRLGRTHSVKFPPAAMQIIRDHRQPRAVPWPHSQEHFRQEFKSLLLAAGVRRGCWKWLRRSAGTYAELERAGSGHRLLGNTPRIFYKHYDASQSIDPRPVEPPRLRLTLPWWRRIWLFRPGA